MTQQGIDYVGINYFREIKVFDEEFSGEEGLRQSQEGGATVVVSFLVFSDSTFGGLFQ